MGEFPDSNICIFVDRWQSDIQQIVIIVNTSQFNKTNNKPRYNFSRWARDGENIPESNKSHLEGNMYDFVVSLFLPSLIVVFLDQSLDIFLLHKFMKKKVYDNLHLSGTDLKSRF